MNEHPRSHFRLLLLVFVLSGFAGLIYQSVWSHYLGLFLGHAAYAQALVLAIFMGGMAAGAALVARAGERWGNLVRGYAVVEAVIGVIALMFHWIFVGLLGLSYDVIIPALGEPWLISAYKWLLAALIILPQTVLLGMTFPLMSGGIIRRYPGSDGHVLGGLYFTNSIGAAVGVLCAAFLIMPRVGLDGAMIAAGIINLIVAALAWGLGRGSEVARPARNTSADHAEAAPRSRLLRVVLVATFVSAAASFAYELIWIRMLSLAVGSTLHAFELMLASFIAGIALGGLWVRRHADEHPNPMRLVGWLQVLMGLAALLSLVLYANAFSWVGYLMQALGRSDAGYDLFMLGTAAVSIVIMMPAAFFAGTTLPLFTVALLRDGQGEGSIGRVYAWNTLGAIAGVFLSIHFLIPVLGLKLGLVLAALVDMAIGIALLRLWASGRGEFVRTGLALASVLAAVVLSLTMVRFDPLQLASGVYRSGQPSLPQGTEVLYYRDGKTTSVSAVVTGGGYAAIATNGKVDASILIAGDGSPAPDEPTMVLAAALPLAYRDEVRVAGVIGFGSGLTTHTLLADPAIERVDTIEIEQAMVDGAQIFGERVARAYLDPRSRIVIDDAKSHLSGQPGKYDLIVSEPSNPWISGVGALFSREFYQFVPRFLNEDGVFVQWLQLYEIDDELVGSVLAALAPAFADYRAYLANTSDLLIVASMKPLPDAPDFGRLFAGELGQDLKRVGITHPEQLAFRRVADARMIRAMAAMHEGAVNSDYFPVLSLNAPRTRFRNASARTLVSLPVAPLPVLEMAGISAPPASEVSPGIVSHFPRADHLRRARLMRDLMLGRETVEAATDYPATHEAVFTFKAFLADCRRDWSDYDERFFINRLQYLAESVLAYLPPAELGALFSQPGWLDCGPLPQRAAAALQFVEAAAARDLSALAESGERWLERRSEGFEAFDAFVLQWMMLAHAQMSEFARAEGLLLEYSHLSTVASGRLMLQLWRARSEVSN